MKEKPKKCGKKKMIYTPQQHIPVGEVVEISEGHKVLRIKKPGEKATEDISIEYLISSVMNTKNV